MNLRSQSERILTEFFKESVCMIISVRTLKFRDWFFYFGNSLPFILVSLFIRVCVFVPYIKKLGGSCELK